MVAREIPRYKGKELSTGDILDVAERLADVSNLKDFTRVNVFLGEDRTVRAHCRLSRMTIDRLEELERKLRASESGARTET